MSLHTGSIGHGRTIKGGMLMLGLAIASGCTNDLPTMPESASPRFAHAMRDGRNAASGAHVVIEWNETMLATLAGQTPFAQARLAAITQLAVFEAVNAITQHYAPYLGTVAAPEGASAEAAAAAAAHAVLSHFFPAQTPGLDGTLATSLAAIPDGTAKADGIAVGTAAAAALIAHRSNDGAAPPRFHLPSSSDPGDWQLTPACPAAGGVFLHWGDVLPFGINASEQFRSAPPPSLRSLEYARDYNEVKRVGALNSTARSKDRADAARFYNAALAPFIWNSVARQLAVSQHTSLTTSARALALLSMAISDGLVTVMETKYVYDFWRPETAIRAGNADGNRWTSADPGFTPFITTPCFPSYGSAHATASYAARTVFEHIFGVGQHRITLSLPAVPGVVFHYRKLRQITDDIDDARVFGGIHFRFDQKAGAAQGRAIGRSIVQNRLERKLRQEVSRPTLP